MLQVLDLIMGERNGVGWHGGHHTTITVDMN